MSETLQCSNDGMNWVPVNTLALQYFKFYRIVSDGVISAMGQTNTFNLKAYAEIKARSALNDGESK